MYGQQVPLADPRQEAMALRRRLESRQNVFLAIAGASVGAAVGAALWAVVTVVTNIQIGFMAVGVGWLVGQLTWHLGRGLTPVYGVIGALFALAGCVVGNLLSACYFVSQLPEVDLTFWQVIGRLDGELFKILMDATFHPIDILFYLIAVYEGWRFSFRKLAI